MAKRITIRDRGEVIGHVVEGGRWKDAPGHQSADILLVGGTYAQIERTFMQRSQHCAPSESEGRMYQDEYTFHFSE